MMVDSSSDSPTLSSRSSKKAEGKQVEKENPALVLPQSLLASEVGLGTISTGLSTLETVLVQTPLQRTTPLSAEPVAAASAPVETLNNNVPPALPTVAVDTTTTATSQQEEQFSQQQQESQQKVPSHLNTAVHKELSYSPGSRDTAEREAPPSVSETTSSLVPASQSTLAATPSMVASSSLSAPKKRVMTAAVMTSASNCAIDAMATEKVGKKLKKASFMNGGGGGNGHKNNKSNNNHSTSSSSSRFATGRWTDAEHQAFLQGLATYGREWKRVAVHIPTRTSAQVRSHAQKYFAKRQAEQAEQAAAAVAAAAAASVRTSATTTVAVGSGNGNSTQASSDSFRAHVERILSEPETVQAEVNATLQQLRQRYAELQQRLQEQQLRQQEQQQRRSTNGSRNDDDERRQPAEGAEPDAHADADSSWTSQSMESLQDSELIALHVLRGGLPHHHTEDEAEQQQQPPLPDAAGRRNSSGSSMDSVANQSCHNGHTHQSTANGANGSDPTSHANNNNKEL